MNARDIHTPPRASTTAKTDTNPSARVLVSRRGRGTAIIPDGGAIASASRNCAAVANRSAGTLASALRIGCSTASGTVSLAVRRAGGGSNVFRAKIACGLVPVNGGSPASISYATQPSE